MSTSDESVKSTPDQAAAQQLPYQYGIEESAAEAHSFAGNEWQPTAADKSGAWDTYEVSPSSPLVTIRLARSGRPDNTGDQWHPWRPTQVAATLTPPGLPHKDFRSPSVVPLREPRRLSHRLQTSSRVTAGRRQKPAGTRPERREPFRGLRCRSFSLYRPGQRLLSIERGART